MVENVIQTKKGIKIISADMSVSGKSSCMRRRLVLVTAWFRVQLTINLTSGN